MRIPNTLLHGCKSETRKRAAAIITIMPELRKSKRTQQRTQTIYDEAREQMSVSSASTTTRQSAGSSVATATSSARRGYVVLRHKQQRRTTKCPFVSAHHATLPCAKNLVPHFAALF